MLATGPSCGTGAAQERPASIDCSKERGPLVTAVCGNRAAIAAERRATATYLALYFSLDEDKRPALRKEHLDWMNRLATACTPVANPPPSSRGVRAAGVSRDCVTRLLTLRSDFYRGKLSGDALGELSLSTADQGRIQKRLVELKFLSGSINGMFGANTRLAIRKFKASIGHPEGNFLTAQERDTLLGSAGSRPLGQAAALSPLPAVEAAPSPAGWTVVPISDWVPAPAGAAPDWEPAPAWAPLPDWALIPSSASPPEAASMRAAAASAGPTPEEPAQITAEASSSQPPPAEAKARPADRRVEDTDNNPTERMAAGPLPEPAPTEQVPMGNPNARAVEPTTEHANSEDTPPPRGGEPAAKPELRTDAIVVRGSPFARTSALLLVAAVGPLAAYFAYRRSRRLGRLIDLEEAAPLRPRRGPVQSNAPAPVPGEGAPAASGSPAE